MSVDYKLIGGRIKAARNKLGYTQEVLAEKLEVSVGYVSQVERGITKISLDLLAEIATVLNCGLSMLIEGANVGSKRYMSAEISDYYSMLGVKDKRLALEFIKLLVQNGKE